MNCRRNTGNTPASTFRRQRRAPAPHVDKSARLLYNEEVSIGVQRGYDAVGPTEGKADDKVRALPGASENRRTPLYTDIMFISKTKDGNKYED